MTGKLFKRLFGLNPNTEDTVTNWLLVGLGNPGPQYAHHRHNIGFMVLDQLARREGFSFSRSQFKGLISQIRLQEQKVTLLKPMTFMNLSGHAVSGAAGYYRVTPSHIVVVHDDIDLPFGRIKVKSEGGHGGHNGLRSITSQLGTGAYQRVRVGIGRPHESLEVTSHVLGPFSAQERNKLSELVEDAADAATAVVTKGVLAAMNEVNGTDKQK